MLINEEDYLAHYGILRKSGRYPWGSGEDQSAIHKMFLDHVDDMKRQGLSESEIAKGCAVSIAVLRDLKTIAKAEQKQALRNQVARLKYEKGYSNVKIGEIIGKNESVVRSLLADAETDRASILKTTSDMLREQVAKKPILDVGTGVELYIGVSRKDLNTALTLLKEEGYEVHRFKSPQLGTGYDTEYKVLCPPGMTQKEAWLRRNELQQINSYSEDGGRTQVNILPPVGIDPHRVGIKYGSEGGAKADGVIFVRPGLEDISLGNSMYAQVRVKVGDGHFLKGMAMYKDDLPTGVDLLFNTVKENETGDKLDVMKPLEKDPDLPFGTLIKRQLQKKNDDGSREVTSVMNIVNEEGDWTKWSKNIASQVLSKQSPKLAREQLAMTQEQRQNDFDAIMKLTNPTVRKKLLKEFSESTDKASVHLKAAQLPRQGWHAILPIASIPPTQIYAPNFQNGERVALIRYPHGGTFEIAELVVNNNHAESRRLLGRNPKDAVGIHHTVAERLSGADFDGDTVLVIPNDSNKIKSTPALEDLKNFNPRVKYKKYPGMKVMSNTQTEMGKISNLITDMTIKNASTIDLAHAIKHSMVVIDAERHELNYKQSAIDNNIRVLKQKYQTQPDGKSGASTIISRAKSQVRVLDRKDRLSTHGGPVDPVTGKKMYEPTNKKNYKTGELKTIKTTKLAEADDAHTLSSGTPIERLYADHSNTLKKLANQARLAMINTPALKYSSSANKTYAVQVATLDSKLRTARMNAPLERQANIIAVATYKAKLSANPHLSDEDKKKAKFQSLEEARARTGAKKKQIKIEPDEWDAIQAGAVSNKKLEDILDNADMDVVREIATPRDHKLMTSTKTRRAQQMLDDGYTRAQVASHLGVSLTTLDVATTSEG